MTRKKKEKRCKQIKESIWLWISQKGFWYSKDIDYMCNDISRAYQCSPYLVKRIFWELKKNDESFKKLLSDFEI